MRNRRVQLFLHFMSSVSCILCLRYMDSLVNLWGFRDLRGLRTFRYILHVLMTFVPDVREMHRACQEKPLSPGVDMKFQEVPIPMTIHVSGLGTSTADDAIKLYFSNKKRNGGGPVETVERSSDKRSAIVHFENCEG